MTSFGVFSCEAVQLEPDLICYGSLLKACEAHETERVLQRMAFDELRPNVVIYSSMIKSLEKVSEVNKALEIFMQMRRGEADAIAYNSMISAFEKGHGTEK